MKIIQAFLNGFEVHINIRKEGQRMPDVRNLIPADVEICRTVFEDNRGRMVYNVHKHKSNCRGTRDTLWTSNKQEGLLC